MTTGRIVVRPSAAISVSSPPCQALRDAVDHAGAERGDVGLQVEDEGLERRVARRSCVCERTITTSLALIGMSMRSASRSRPTCESGSPRKLYCAVSAPGAGR